MNIEEIRHAYAKWVQQTQPDAADKLHRFWEECRQHDWELYVQMIWIAGLALAFWIVELVVFWR